MLVRRLNVQLRLLFDESSGHVFLNKMMGFCTDDHYFEVIESWDEFVDSKYGI